MKIWSALKALFGFVDSLPDFTEPMRKPSPWTTAEPIESGLYVGYNGTTTVTVRLLSMDGLVIDNQLLLERWGASNDAFEPCPMLWLRIDVDPPTWTDKVNARLANIDLDKRR